jgi:hypothetical protein
MLRRIPSYISFPATRTGLQGMRVNSSALRKRELGKTLDSSLESSEFPSPLFLVLSVLAAAMLSESSPIKAPCSTQSKMHRHTDVLKAA